MLGWLMVFALKKLNKFKIGKSRASAELTLPAPEESRGVGVGDGVKVGNEGRTRIVLPELTDAIFLCASGCEKSASNWAEILSGLNWKAGAMRRRIPAAKNETTSEYFLKFIILVSVKPHEIFKSVQFPTLGNLVLHWE